MSSKIIRFVLLATFLVTVSVIGCKDPAQDACTEAMALQEPPASCEIDMGCGEDPIPGTCQIVGSENPTPTCVAN